ncbi:hypothetical protein AB0A73_28200 [Glycomyces sp. NPDC047369]
MRPLLPIAVVALAAAGCSASTDAALTSPSGGHQQAAEEDSPLAGVTDPVALEIQAPEGFTLDEALVREVPLSDAVNTYSFRLDGGTDTAVIQVSTYVLPEPVDDSDYRGAVAYIREYDAQLGYEYTLENDRGTIAHGRAGVGMLTGFPVGSTEVVQQNHYFFEASHAIQVTCQWSNSDFVAVYDGCKSLLTAFPFPDGWDA